MACEEMHIFKLTLDYKIVLAQKRGKRVKRVKRKYIMHLGCDWLRLRGLIKNLS